MLGSLGNTAGRRPGGSGPARGGGGPPVARALRSADAQKALELTYREALRLGHNYVGTEHILLGLLEHEDGSGTLADLGVTKPPVEAGIAQLLGSL